MIDLTNKRKREEEMEGEIGDLETENALLKAEVNKLKMENQSSKESEANEKVKVSRLESEEKNLLAEFSHMRSQMAKVEVNKAKASGLEEKTDDDTPVFHFAVPPSAKGLDIKSIEEIQSKTVLGKAGEANAAGILFLAAGGPNDARLQKMTTSSSEVKADIQDEVEKTVEEGKVIIPQDELKKYKKAVEEVKKQKQVSSILSHKIARLERIRVLYTILAGI